MPDHTSSLHRTLVLVSDNRDWLYRLTMLAARLPGDALMVAQFSQRTETALACVYIRDGGAPLPPLAGLPACREHWLVQPNALSDRELAFGQGFTEVLPADMGDIELGIRLEGLSNAGKVDLLLEGLAGFCGVTAAGLAAPLQFLGLGQAATLQELETLRPLFLDLHKANFPDGQALLEKLRLILGVINLKDSWNRLEQTVRDLGSGIERIREIQTIQYWLAGMAEPDLAGQTIHGLVQTCLGFLKDSAGAGVSFANRLPPGQNLLVPSRLFLSALLATVVHILALMERAGNGRGTLEFRGLASDKTWLERRKSRPGNWSDHSLIIRIKLESAVMPGHSPAFGLESALFARLGAQLDWLETRGVVELGVWLPAPRLVVERPPC